MNHQYFKEWLTTDEPLTSDQAQKLEDHIKECQNCHQLQAAWSDVQHILKDIQDVEPLPGFTSRWEGRLARERKQGQKRLTWIVFASLAGSAFLIMVLLGLHVFELIRSPEQIALVFLSRFAVLFSYLTITKNYLSFFSASIPEISFPVIVFASGFLTILCVLWLAAMKQISSVWRIVK
jgi:hypothetical protein